MNVRSVIVLSTFALWSGGSWYWYTCKIKQKCAFESNQEIVAQDTTLSEDTSTSMVETPVEIDTVALMEQGKQSVVETDTMITLRFQTNSTKFDKDSTINAFLDRLVERMKNGEVKTLKVLGHTDDVGASEPNMKLSIARAIDVKNVLIKKGAKGDIITTEGKGEDMPLSTENTPEARNLNRRVELKISK
jgi:outer membrane protein OmpA-like peptidoglycan-associated protein